MPFEYWTDGEGRTHSRWIPADRLPKDLREEYDAELALRERKRREAEFERRHGTRRSRAWPRTWSAADEEELRRSLERQALAEIERGGTERLLIPIEEKKRRFGL